MIDIISAIIAIDKTAQVTVDNNDINKIIWHCGNKNNITQEQILSKQKELIAEYESKEYQRKRKEEYPAIVEFIEAYTEKQILGKSEKWEEYENKYLTVRNKYTKEA